jgi:DUF4097 and DUF4098 domain-containing protein YvlB
MVFAASPAAASVQGSFQRTYQVAGPVDLEALTRSGDVIIRSGPAGTVTISGKIYVEDRWLMGDRHTAVSEIEQNPPIHQSGNSIRIDYVNVHGISVDYEITVPVDTDVRTQTGSGDQRVEDLHGRLNLESGSGDLRLRNTTGEMRLHTGSGDVEARDVSGPITAGTGSGDVRVDAKGPGDVHVTSGSGTIELQDVKGGLMVETGSGDVTVKGEQTAAWEIRTSSGNVDVALPANAGFNLDASTGSGEIETSRQVVAVVQGKVGASRSRITGKANGGGPELRVHTSSGDINVN